MTATPSDRLYDWFCRPPGGPASTLLARAAEAARASGHAVLLLGLQEAESPEALARVHAAIAQQALRDGRPAIPTLIASAGPVRVPDGMDAAAQLLLALALSVDEHIAVHGLALGPDGASGDGTVCRFTPASLQRARTLGLDPTSLYAANGAAALFAALDDREILPGAGACTDIVRAILLN